MPRFKCVNKECSNLGKEELFAHVRFVWNSKVGKLEADEAECKVCGQQRETVREKGDIKIPWFKAENAKNYDNKRIKKYDYDVRESKPETITIPSQKKREGNKKN